MMDSDKQGFAIEKSLRMHEEARELWKQVMLACLSNASFGDAEAHQRASYALIKFYEEWQ